MSAQIAASADVATSAVIGDGSSIWHLAQVREDAQIGEGCVIGRGAYIGSGVRLGKHCKVQNYALVYEPAVLEDGVFVGPAAVLTNDQYPRAVEPDGSLKTAEGHQQTWQRIGRFDLPASALVVSSTAGKQETKELKLSNIRLAAGSH